MDNNSLNQDSAELKILHSLGIILKLVGFVFCGTAITKFIFDLILGMNGQSLEAILRGPDYAPDTKSIILSVQGFNSFVTFIVLPVLYIFYFNKSLLSILKFKKDNMGAYAVIAILIIFSSIPIINLLSEWNKSINLPDFFKSAEQWMVSRESMAKKLTEFIAYFSNPGEFIIILFVIAVLPAIGEEILFHGVIQNEFMAVLKNPHVAIWITGFIFSFFHFQFFGFFPRMLLGVTFGYLYYWSGNLWIPILAHFLNNALTLIVMNLYKQKAIETDFESTDSIPLISIIISIIIFTFLLFTFSKLRKQKNKATI